MAINIFTLGCKVNQYESGRLGSALRRRGFSVAYGLIPPAELYVLNTCAVTAEAERKSRQAVARIRRAAPDAKIIVYGCASQNCREAFIGKPGVAGVYGTEDVVIVAEEIAKKLGIRSEALGVKDGEQYLKTVYGEGRARAYIKAQDGCDSFCSYCIVPHLKGRSRSRPISEITAEAERLSGQYKEIVLIGINLSDYGKQMKNDKGQMTNPHSTLHTSQALTDLITALADIPARIRLGSLECQVITRPFLQSLQNLKAFCPHFHLSLQSGSDKILRAMNRHYTAAEYLDKVKLIRFFFPNAGITTDIICGFPGETDEDFEMTCRTAEAAAFSDIHIFPYSEREGTAAAKSSEPCIPKALILERVKILSEIRGRSRSMFLRNLTNGSGNDMIVLLERTAGGISEGYSENYIRCYCKEPLRVGEQYRVRAAGVWKDGLEVVTLKA